MGASRGWLWVPCVGMLLVLPALGTGLSSDDYVQQTLIRARLSGQTSPGVPGGGASGHWWDLYTWADGDVEQAKLQRWTGVRPWWAALDVRVRFLRPLAAATHYVDHAQWPGAPWAMHLQSVLWYGLACLALVLVARRLAGDGRVAVLAGLLYAADEAHVAPAGWLANRHATMSAGLALFALLAFDRLRHDDWRPGRWLAPLLLALALLAGETAAPTVLLMALLPVLRAPRPGALRALLPCLAVTALWLVAYRALGYGAHGSGAYLSPIDDPWTFATHAPTRALELLVVHFGPGWAAGELLELPAVLVLRDLATWVFVLALGLALGRRLPARGPLAFWTAASVVTLLPALAAAPHDRLLVLAGACLWVAASQLAIELWDHRAQLAGPTRALAGAVWGLGAAFHLGLAPASLAHGVGPWGDATQALQGARVLRIDQPPRALQDARLVVVNAPNLLHAMAIGLEHRRLGYPTPASIQVLGTTLHEVHATRLDARTLRLYTPFGYLEDLSNVWRSPGDPLQTGERVHVQGWSVRVARRTADGRPLEVEFRFDRDLDDPQLQLAHWNGRVYVPLDLAPAGRRMLLPNTF